MPYFSSPFKTVEAFKTKVRGGRSRDPVPHPKFVPRPCWISLDMSSTPNDVPILAANDVKCSITEQDVIDHMRWFVDLEVDLKKAREPSCFEVNPRVLEDFGCNSYERFLHLARKANSLSPTMLIDLMWHAHLMNPKTYEDECFRCVGRILEHDVGNPGNAEETKKLWSKEFNVEIERDYLFDD